MNFRLLLLAQRLLASGGLAAYTNSWQVCKSLDRARHLLQKLIPPDKG